MRSSSSACIAITVLLCVTLSESHAQSLPTGPQVLTFFSDVDDTDQPYALYLPNDFDSSHSYPLVVSLHGAGSNHRLNLRRVFGKSNVDGETDAEASRYFPEWEDVDYIVAAPYARGTMGYQGVAEKDVMDVLGDVTRRFLIDRNRMYLTGLSMGGGGTLWIGLTRPDLWAAIAPVCPAPPGETPVFAPNALNIPIHIFQGDADSAVRPEGVRRWVDDLRGLDTRVEYTEYPGVGHNSWENAYANGQIFEWFSQFERNPFPDRVRFRSDRYKYSKAYWVELDGLTPGTPAGIDARLEATNRLVITTEGLDGFTLHLAGHPQYDPARAASVEIDGNVLSVRPSGAFSFSRRGSDWVQARYERAKGDKRDGAEGPVSEVISSRHVYVYGTAGNPSSDELTARRLQAEKAAEWSVYRGWFLGRVMVFPRVVADRELRQSDLDGANLVLFGTRESNSAIAEMAERLPIHLTGDSNRFGLVYVYPRDGRYVLVSSGIPWWGPAGSAQQGFGAQVPAFQLGGVQDYLLFEGSPDQPIASGRFDRYWRIPSEEEAKLRSAEAVTLQPVVN